MKASTTLTPERYGQFEIVLLLGVLYHLPDPMRALDIVFNMMRPQARLFLETIVIDDELPPEIVQRPLMQFYPKATKNLDYTNFWGMAEACAIALLEECEWKTSSARYPEEPEGIAALDPQLVCYSWMTGINDVAQVVFVRKRTVEVQYLRATITDQQRLEFETLVEDTVLRIESGLFLPHSGIRFPQNPCTACPFVGLCLDQRDLVESGLIRKPGVDLGLFDELAY